jgi:hypothetical protein
MNLDSPLKILNSKLRLLHNLIVAQQHSYLPENRRTVAQTVKNHTTHDQTVCATACVAQIV